MFPCQNLCSPYTSISRRQEAAPDTSKSTSRKRSSVHCRASSKSVIPKPVEAPLWRLLHTAASCAVACTVSLGPVNGALAAKLSVPIENATYSEVSCKGNSKVAGQGNITCIEFTGTVNNTNKKAINTADVYGRVYDGAKNDVTDNEENDRIAYVDLIPPGVSTVSFTLSVPASQLELGPLSWKSLKASGFTGQVLPGQAGLLGLLDEIDCSTIGPDSDIFDIEQCEEQELENSIR
ncbi:hypothetical protein CYMTET_3180 [Cymbomonas tetramitiformis]|uniref:Uncharacterized protein n=1 Tax=Cymbomonas tetramitiformis TaxID=36881 RepID=A0AAE0H473_9CHLO|nr:hypothetical protein CYMTET_3180 [Cymbomonas tetramitiformis]